MKINIENVKRRPIYIYGDTHVPTADNTSATDRYRRHKAVVLPVYTYIF